VGRATSAGVGQWRWGRSSYPGQLFPDVQGDWWWPGGWRCGERAERDGGREERDAAAGEWRMGARVSVQAMGGREGSDRGLYMLHPSVDPTVGEKPLRI
jgi:hypothetical protein